MSWLTHRRYNSIDVVAIGLAVSLGFSYQAFLLPLGILFFGAIISVVAEEVWGK